MPLPFCNGSFYCRCVCSRQRIVHHIRSRSLTIMVTLLFLLWKQIDRVEMVSIVAMWTHTAILFALLFRLGRTHTTDCAEIYANRYHLKWNETVIFFEWQWHLKAPVVIIAIVVSRSLENCMSKWSWTCDERNNQVCASAVAFFSLTAARFLFGLCIFADKNSD